MRSLFLGYRNLTCPSCSTQYKAHINTPLITSQFVVVVPMFLCLTLRNVFEIKVRVLLSLYLLFAFLLFSLTPFVAYYVKSEQTR